MSGATGKRPRFLFGLLALVSVALFFSARGGGGDKNGGGSSTIRSREAAPPEDTTRSAPVPDDEPPASADGRPSAGEGSSADEGDTSESDSSGQVSSRSAGFLGSKTRLKHLPEYGSEASAGERDQVQQALASYLRAAVDGDWSQACTHIAVEVLAQVRQLMATQPELADCGQALSFYVATLAPTADFHDYVGSTVASFRAEDGAGFALIHGEGGQDLWVAMKFQEGRWRVLTLVPRSF